MHVDQCRPHLAAAEINAGDAIIADTSHGRNTRDLAIRDQQIGAHDTLLILIRQSGGIGEKTNGHARIDEPIARCVGPGYVSEINCHLGLCRHFSENAVICHAADCTTFRSLRSIILRPRRCLFVIIHAPLQAWHGGAHHLDQVAWECIKRATGAHRELDGDGIDLEVVERNENEIAEDRPLLSAKEVRLKTNHRCQQIITTTKIDAFSYHSHLLTLLPSRITLDGWRK
ncbi:hypothetical protein V1284_007803 [Nitrobacteraceae bacterium AZCC 2299]